MRGPFRTSVLIAVILAGAALSSCADDTEPVEAQVATYSPMTMAGTMQTLKGTLLIEEGCVYVEDGQTR